MAGEIFIETGKTGPFGLPLAEHLYLVFRDTDGREYVLRAGPDNPLWPFGEMRIEENVPIEDSADSRDGETPEERSSTPLDFPDLTDDQAWAVMVKYVRALEAADYRYNLLDANSNAFVGALLHAAGGEPGAMLPEGLDSGDAIGFSRWDDIVEDVTPPGDWIFRGTAGADVIAGLQIDEWIFTRSGDDLVRSGRGADFVRGGLGADSLLGQQGDDRLFGGAGTDHLSGGSGEDLLRGGRGNDRIKGGLGDDLLFGGEGADTFVFTARAGNGVDRIGDFVPGLDRLQLIGLSATEDLGIAEVTEGGVTSAELTWNDHRILFTGAFAEELAEEVLQFV